jgi:hypothetical protein
MSMESVASTLDVSLVHARNTRSLIRPRKVSAALGALKGFLLSMTAQVSFQMLRSSEGAATNGALNVA